MKTKVYNFLAILIIFTLLLNSCSTVPVTNAPIPSASTTTTSPAPIVTPTITPLPPTPTLVPETAFIKGITLNYSGGQRLDATGAQEVIQRYIIPSGANYVALIPTCWSTNMGDTNIVCSDSPIQGGVPPVTDSELINAIQHLHSVGLRVVLKPQALVQTVIITSQELKDRHYTKAQWNAWFDSYTKFITHYAQIAEDNYVDLFVVGNEQEDNTQREQEWRDVITAVRNVYHGKITYAANAWQFEASKIKFWDVLDYIGTNGYWFGFVNKKDPTIDDMMRAWRPYVQQLEEMSKQYGKQVIITEIGARPVQGFNQGGVSDAKASYYDGQEQADFYSAFFGVLKDKPWLKGIILWDVNTDPLQGGPNDIAYTFIAKPAEQVVRQYFGGSPITPTPTPYFIEEPVYSKWIYQDGLENGWRPWNEPNATIVPNLSSPNGHQSSFSIRVPVSKYKELQLVYDTPHVKMSIYKWIEFYIMVGKREPTTLFVMFGYWTPQAYTFSRKVSVNNSNYIEGGQYVPATWQKVRIPLVDFGITNQIFNEFHISACDWPCSLDPNVDDIYIDDIQLVAGKSP